MSYVKATNFAVKDALPSGDPNKIIRGTEIDTEFNALQTATGLLAPKASPTFTGTVALPIATLSGTLNGVSFPTGGIKISESFFRAGSASTVTSTIRVASSLGAYYNSGAPEGAIIITAPTTATNITHSFELTVNNGKFFINGFRNTGAWSGVKVFAVGGIQPGIRLGVTPAGRNCIIVGQEFVIWSNLLVSLDSAVFVGAGVTDAYAGQWDIAVVNDLTGYTELTTGAFDDIVTSVSSAVELKTPRNINGTSFNGTADITTTTWGTGRTLTVGDTGKSVNGSADVAWTVSEIGAVDVDLLTQQTLTGTAINWSTSFKAKLTRSANATVTFTAPPTGTNLALVLVLSAGAAITWPAEVKWPNGTVPTLGNGTHFIGFYYDGTDYLGGVLESYA